MIEPRDADVLLIEQLVQVIEKQNSNGFQNLKELKRTPRRQVVFELETQGIARILDQVDDLFVLEALCFDAVYGDNHVAYLQLVTSMRNAARFQVAYARSTILVRAACYGQSELTVVHAC